MRKTILLCLIGLGIVSHLMAQKRYTIHGYISEQSSGESLIGAFVRNELNKQGTVSDSYGHFSLTQKEGRVRISFSYVGLKTKVVEWVLNKDTTLNIRLEDASLLSEVVVEGNRNPSGVSTSQMGAIAVPAEQLKKIPAIFGENDIIKSLQLLPGVQGGTEGTSGIYVRGGGPDQNLIMLDGLPIYNVNHMMGLFSNFNSDAIKGVTLYKGNFPARFGSRLSSVIDVRSKDGNQKKIQGNLSVGMISSRVNIEGPILNEKTTFNFSARRTYLDLLLRPMIWATQRYESLSERVDGGYDFYDLNLKVTHRFSDKDQISFLGYRGDDTAWTKRKEQEDASSLSWSWGNMLAALNWNHVINGQLFLNTTMSYNRYRSALKLTMEEKEENEIISSEGRYNSGIRDLSVKSVLNYTPSHNHNALLGVEYTNHLFRPDATTFSFGNRTINPKDIGLDSLLNNPTTPANEFALFVEDDATLLDWLKVNFGVRYSMFQVESKTYHSVEPRVSAVFQLSDVFSLKAGYARMSQYIHLLSTNQISLPTDLWVPATNRIAPMKSNQYSLGAYYHWRGVGDFSVEGYYKTMSNLIEYKDGAGFLLQSKGWDELVAMGDGKAYGLEFLYQRSFGNTTGWIGYTWSRSLRQFNRPGEELNEGNVFPAKYDRIHDFSIAATHTFNEKWDVSASWVFSTGNAGTKSLQNYLIYEDGRRGGVTTQEDGYPSVMTVGEITSRNNFRYPNYHRLDLSVNYHKKYKSGRKGTWNLSIYNVYRQLNPMIIIDELKEVKKDGKTYYKNQLVGICPFPFIPSISYTYTF